MTSFIDAVEVGTGVELGADIGGLLRIGDGLTVELAVAPGPELPQPDTMRMTIAATSAGFPAGLLTTVKRFIVTLSFRDSPSRRCAVSGRSR
jgi:hypothetical protein